MVITISMSMEIVSIDAGAGILIYLQSKKREIAGVFDVHIGKFIRVGITFVGPSVCQDRAFEAVSHPKAILERVLLVCQKKPG